MTDGFSEKAKSLSEEYFGENEKSVNDTYHGFGGSLSDTFFKDEPKGLDYMEENAPIHVPVEGAREIESGSIVINTPEVRIMARRIPDMIQSAQPVQPISEESLGMALTPEQEKRLEEMGKKAVSVGKEVYHKYFELTPEQKARIKAGVSRAGERVKGFFSEEGQKLKSYLESKKTARDSEKLSEVV